MDDIVTVSEDETAAAILSLMENQKLVAEGAGAVPVDVYKRQAESMDLSADITVLQNMLKGQGLS